jgi:hypothetical protein
LPGAQISAHAQRRFDALVVAGQASDGAVAQAFIKQLGSFVSGPHFQFDFEYAGYDGAFFEPLEKSLSKAGSSVRRRHGEKVQVRVVRAVAHDRKPGNVLASARDEHIDVKRANARLHPRWSPTPFETILDQLAGQIGNGGSIRGSRQTEPWVGTGHGAQAYQLFILKAGEQSSSAPRAPERSPGIAKKMAEMPCSTIKDNGRHRGEASWQTD